MLLLIRTTETLLRKKEEGDGKKEKERERRKEREWGREGGKKILNLLGISDSVCMQWYPEGCVFMSDIRTSYYKKAA